MPGWLIQGGASGGGGTMTGAEIAAALNTTDTSGMTLQDVGAVEYRVNTVAASGATETLDTSLFSVHKITMDVACVFTFSNPAPAGELTAFLLYLYGAFTPTFPATVDWGDATAPTYTTPSLYGFFTLDAGVTWYGVSMGKAFG